VLVDGEPKSFSGGTNCSDFSGASCSLVGEVTGREVTVDFASIDAAFNALPMSMREAIQRRLADRGLYRSAIDGATGPATRGAIRNAARSALNAGQSVRLDSEEAVRSFLDDFLSLDLSTLPEEPAFLGEWDCEGGIFSFQPEGYLVGQTGKRLPYFSIEEGNPGDYGLTFVDGYRLGLFDVTDSSMTWSSPASGDIFSCSRVSDVTPLEIEKDSTQEETSRNSPRREVAPEPSSDNPDMPFLGRWSCTSDMFPSATAFEFNEDAVNVPAMGRRTEYTDVGRIGGRETAFLINLRDDQQAAIFELEDARMLMTAAGGLFECKRDPA
jgi:peptidoglycan hydrolase-like protein with peptidoglycan-binding domain